MIAYFRAYFRCLFHMEKYRLFTLELSDGTILTGCVTEESAKEFTK